MAGGVMRGLPMLGWASTMYPNFQNPETKVKVESMAVDYNFVKTMGIPVINGREFSEEYGSDLTQSVMLNEMAVKELGISGDPIGQLLGKSTIIGIVKDFNLHSVHTGIPPLAIHMTDRYIQQVAVHYKPETLSTIIPFIEAEWKKAAPDRPFQFSTIESLIENLYSSEKKPGRDSFNICFVYFADCRFWTLRTCTIYRQIKNKRDWSQKSFWKLGCCYYLFIAQGKPYSSLNCFSHFRPCYNLLHE